jgi:hypothetical protein
MQKPHPAGGITKIFSFREVMDEQAVVGPGSYTLLHWIRKHPIILLRNDAEIISGTEK